MAATSPEQLRRLFDRHAAALALYARQWSDDPEDVVQDAFIQLARHRGPIDRPAPWLFRVVRNGAIAASRGRDRRRRREARASTGEAWFAATDDQIDAHHAEQLLAELDVSIREVIVARLWGGLTFDEIAKLQGSSIATAHRRYQSGLARLQERLAPHDHARA